MSEKALDMPSTQPNHGFMPPPKGEITAVLAEWSKGDHGAAGKALPLIYGELRSIADAYLARERRNHTLQATALVHEAYMKLMATEGVEWRSREEFFGFSAHLMRRILVDHARRRNACKRGSGELQLTLDEVRDLPVGATCDLIALDDALTDLGAQDGQMAAIVELRIFGGLTIAEAARHLDIPRIKVNRQWRRALAWLYRELSGAERVGV